MQTTSRYASRTSASLGEGHSFIALRFGKYTTAKLSHLRPNLFMLSWQKRCVCFTDKTDLELMSFAAKKIMEYLRIKMYTSVVAAL